MVGLLVPNSANGWIEGKILCFFFPEGIPSIFYIFQALGGMAETFSAWLGNVRKEVV